MTAGERKSCCITDQPLDALLINHSTTTHICNTSCNATISERQLKMRQRTTENQRGCPFNRDQQRHTALGQKSNCQTPNKNADGQLHLIPICHRSEHVLCAFDAETEPVLLHLMKSQYNTSICCSTQCSHDTMQSHLLSIGVPDESCLPKSILDVGGGHSWL